jgi:hypothetical protein
LINAGRRYAGYDSNIIEYCSNNSITYYIRAKEFNSFEDLIKEARNRIRDEHV